MEGHDRHLDREASEECQKHEHLGRRGEGVGQRGVGETLDVERHRPRLGGVPEHDREQPQKGQQAAGQRVDKELDGRFPSLLVAPDANQEEERYERELEEHVEEQHVAGREDAEHRRLQNEQQRIEADHPLGDGVPAHKHRRHRQQGR